jgi:intein/homing endonuclease/type IV secretory pathway ATPase VirB11/archaellum biosynthesis ATPase
LVCDYELREGVLRVNCLGCVFGSSIEDFEACMAKTIDKLLEVKNVERIVLAETRENEYDFEQVKILREIAEAYNKILNEEKILTMEKLAPAGCEKFFSKRFSDLQFLILELLRKDPVAAYVRLQKMIIAAKINEEKAPAELKKCFTHYLENALLPIEKILSSCKLIKIAKEKLEGYKPGDRKIYREIFHPLVRPNFMLTRFMLLPPKNAQLLDKYYLPNNVLVEIFKVPGKVRLVYHITPPEFKLTEQKFIILDRARNYLAGHKPTETEITEPQKAREIFFNIGKDLIREIGRSMNLELSPQELEELAMLLARYTAGFGVLELLLSDEKIQDIYINSPIGLTPIFIYHSDFEECETNLIPTREDAEAWATRFRLYSGRPLDEANPVLDCELEVPGGRARVAAITRTLSPEGLAFAFRRHRERPWTFPLFLKAKMFDPLYAGLMSFVVDGGRALLIAGGRSSGKCLVGDSLVQLSDGSLVKIKDLVKEVFKNEGSIIFSDGEIAFPKNLKVITLNENLKLTQANVKAVWKRYSPNKLVEVETSSGKKIVVTPEHPFISIENGSLTEVRADELKKGSRIALPRFLSTETCNLKFDVGDVPKDCILLTLNGKKWFKGKTNSKLVKLPNLDKNFMEFLGYVFGDSSIDKGGIIFHNRNKVLRKRFLRLCKKVFGILPKEEPKNKPIKVDLRSRAIVKFLEKLGIKSGKKANKLALPLKFLKLSKETIKPFIRAYFDCDAYISVKNREIEFSTASKNMADQIQALLLRFGIFTLSEKKIVKGKEYWRIIIRGENVNKYGVIGFKNPLKAKRLDCVLRRKWKHSTYDVIPAEELLINTMEKLRIKLPRSLRSSLYVRLDAYKGKKWSLTREKLKVFMNIISKRRKEILRLSKYMKKLKEFKFSVLAAKKLAKELRQILNSLFITPSDLSKCVNLERKCVKKYLEGKITDLKIAKKIYKAAISLILLRLHKVKGGIESFYSHKFLLNYSELSIETGISETTLKSHFYGNPRLTKYRNSINIVLSDFSKEWNKNVNLIQKKLPQLRMFLDVIEGSIPKNEIKLIVRKLNIDFKEVCESKKIGIKGLSYFDRYNPKIQTLLKVIEFIEDVWDEMNSKKTEENIEKLERLVNSDVFWDKVKCVRIVKSKDKYVYDLTVEPTHNFIANNMIVHNTSLLSALLLEIMRKFRIILQEDSVTGDCEIIINRNGNFEKTTVGNLVDNLLQKYGYKEEGGREILDRNPENVKVFSLDKNGKIVLASVTKFIRHKVSKDIFEIETRTGRKIKVTEDHSLFSLTKGRISPVKVKELKVGDYLATPRILPVINKKIEKLNFIEKLGKVENIFVLFGENKELLRKKRNLLRKISKELGYAVEKGEKYPKNCVNYWIRKGVLPSRVFAKLIEKEEIDTSNLKFKINNSKPIPIEIPLDEKFLSFIGLWLADGCYDKNGVIVSVVDEDTRKIVYEIGKRFGIKVRLHTDGFSLILPSTALKVLMKDLLELKGNAYTKKFPFWVFNLSKEQISYLLKGLFSGDGYLTKDEVGITLASLNLIKDLQSLLLFFGIISRINKMREKDKSYTCKISAQKFIKIFKESIGFLQKERMKKLEEMCERISTHDVTDILPFSLEIKEELSRILPGFNYNDYVKRNQNIGREKFARMVENLSFDGNGLIKELQMLANSDIFWDEIRSIKCLGKIDTYVYDFSVPNCENFVCENILAHNTLELPVTHLRQLGYNIERLKSRSVITRVETEVPADEALRTALRLGDSCLIVGEVRSVESTVLFEAMRIGALANVVAGTIHGESPYGVYDRVVHDLGVAPTSFKAIDLITICNMLRSPDGLHRFRRVVELTEVRKHWKQDPLDEGGFVTLMEYSAKEDRLKPTDTLIDGESYVLNEIAKRVREWHGRWDDVWDNILLRGKIKQTLVEYAEKLNRPEILEADFVCDSNDMFHLISEQVRQEVGALDSKMIYEKWLEWLKERLR